MSNDQETTSPDSIGCELADVRIHGRIGSLPALVAAKAPSTGNHLCVTGTGVFTDTDGPTLAGTAIPINVDGSCNIG